MKRFLWMASVLCVAVAAQAQVQLQLTSQQSQFLPGEDIEVAVRIANFSGRPIRLGGGGNEWLKFGVESIDGGVVSRLSEVPVDLDMELESAARATFRVNLRPHFEISRAGHYRVSAVMALPAADVVATSPPLQLDVVSGSTLWEQEFGVPGSGDGEGAVVDRRKYLLQQANYTKQLRLYLRVVDADDSHTHRVLPLGAMVSFSKPETRVDNLGRLHLLHQDGAKSYAYHLILPDGSVSARRTYEISSTRPKLRVNEDGEVIVFGGVRRVTAADIPKPAEAAETPVLDDPPKAKKS